MFTFGTMVPRLKLGVGNNHFQARLRYDNWTRTEVVSILFKLWLLHKKYSSCSIIFDGKVFLT